MAKVAILTDTNSGYITKDAKKAGIFIMPMPFYVNNKLEYEGISLTQKEFYKLLEEDTEVSTSMPVVGDLLGQWDDLLKKYDEVVYIPMSSGLSSSCETASMLAEDYDGRVVVVDNRRISTTMKLSVLEAKALAERGRSAEEIKDYLEDHSAESSIYIMVDTLKYLKKGGRLTPAVAAIGTLLKIKPVLQIQGGKLDTYAKARTLKQGKNIMIEAIKNDCSNKFLSPDGENLVISIAHTQNKKEAEALKAELKEIFPKHKIDIDPLALSIACHIGPGSLAMTVSKSFLDSI